MWEEKLKKVDKEVIKQVTATHLHRYQNRLRMAQNGSSGYRPDELYHLLSIWEAIEYKDFEVSNMTKSEKAELVDALLDEDLIDY